MPRTTSLHVGVPKTGTTYLQQVLADNRRTLADQGVLYPGRGRDHFMAAQDVMRTPFRGHVDPRVAGSWRRVVGEVVAWDGPSIVSHEILASADDETLARIVDDLGADHLRVVVTARDLLRQLPAVWQETLKNGGHRTLHGFVAFAREQVAAPEHPLGGFWGYQDTAWLVERWARLLPAEQLVVVTVPPPGSAPGLLWQRFASAVGVELPPEALEVPRTNESLGAPEAEWLRRFNARTGKDWEWPRYQRQVKATLVPGALAGSGSEPIRLTAEDARWVAGLSRDVADRLAGQGCTVVGDLADLVPDPAAAERPDPDPVAESAVADVGQAVAAFLLDALRARQPEEAADRGLRGRVADRARRLRARG